MASTLTQPTAKQDAQIQAVLEQAKVLHASLEPLYTWDELCEIIATCQLAVLSRQPEFEALYAQTFAPLVRSAYGGMEVYLRKQLGWGGAPAAASGGKGEEAGEGREEKEYWERHGRTNVRRNDWPYGIPRGTSHWVVWVPLPLFHPALCTPAPTRPSTPLPSSSSSSAPSGTSTPSGESRINPLATSSSSHPLLALGGGGKERVAPTKGTWDWVSRNGLGGLTGRARERWEARKGGERGEQGVCMGGEEGPEREIEAFVKVRWREEDGWETAWFANPPSLQSVPGLAHFHVLARKAGDEASKS
ncbi:hypothetical protein JCM8547_005201 [Rhodosporidiobolus lusitaniae]